MEIKPMLAYQANKVDLQFPYLGQPKLNGFRCVATFETITEGEGLFSKEFRRYVLRTREGLIIDLPHVSYALAKLVHALYVRSDFIEKMDVTYPDLDGELYVHNTSLTYVKKRVPYIMRNGTKTKTAEDPKEIEYHLYDIINSNASQESRIAVLNMLKKIAEDGSNCPIKVVDTVWVKNRDEMTQYKDSYIDSGYEGLMLRNPKAVYEHKRSKNLLKVKKTFLSKHLILDVIDEGLTENMYTIKFLLRNDINNESFLSIPGTLKDPWDNNRKIKALRSNLKGAIAIVSSYDRSGVKKVPFHSNVISVVDDNDKPLI